LHLVICQKNSKAICQTQTIFPKHLLARQLVVCILAVAVALAKAQIAFVITHAPTGGIVSTQKASSLLVATFLLGEARVEFTESTVEPNRTSAHVRQCVIDESATFAVIITAQAYGLLA
jgi:hypothetical protein